MKSILLLITLFLLHNTASACRIAPGYEEFSPSPEYENKTHPLFTPKASLEYIRRGYDDGNGASCSDSATIKIKFEDENPVRATGYKLKIISGTFQSYAIPDYEVMPTQYNSDANVMYLSWFENNFTNQEEIDFVLQIIAISPEGGESEPFNLRIQHAGEKDN